MTHEAPSASPTQPPAITTHRIGTLSVIALLGILTGAILIGLGIASGNGSLLNGPSLNDVAVKITLISLGSTVASAGFFAMLFGLHLAGMRDILSAAHNRS